jgi:hypothetical protein
MTSTKSKRKPNCFKRLFPYLGLATILLYFINIFFLSTSVHAEVSATYPIKWDGNSEDMFEIEITTENFKNIILTKQVKGNSFGLVLPMAGKFNWRVRKQKNGGWETYSPFKEIIAEELVAPQETPLMKSSSVKGNQFSFRWIEPFPDFKYTLNIYRGNNDSPIQSLPVSGGIKTIKLKRTIEKVFWNISAESPIGNKSKDREKYLVPNSFLIPPKAVTDSRKTLYILRLGLHQISSTYDQHTNDNEVNSSNLNTSMTGMALNFRGEAWKTKQGYILGIRKTKLTSTESEYSDIELNGEIGQRWIQTMTMTQVLAVGLNYSNTQILSENSSTKYSTSFLTLRHQYDRMINEQFSWGAETTLMQPLVLEFVIPSLRIYPTLSWHFHSNWWLSLQAGYEQKNTDITNNGDQLETSLNNIVYGLRLNWKRF